MTTADISRAPSTRARDRRGQLIAVALAAFVLCGVELTGGLSSVDRAVLAHFDFLTEFAPRGEQPVVIALDEATLAEHGAPPWGPGLWRDLGLALRAAGVRQAFLVEPAGVVLRRGSASDGRRDDDMTPIYVPAVLQPSTTERGALLRAALTAPVASLLPWAYQLYLPTDPIGRIVDLTEAAQAGGHFGPSAFCVWLGECPTGGALARMVPSPRRPGLLPTISAVDVLEGRFQIGKSTATSGPPVLIGLTAPWHQRHALVGARAVRVSYVEAVGLVIAAARGRRAVLGLSPLTAMLCVLLAVAAATALFGFRYGRAAVWFACAAPLLALAVALAAYYAGLLRLPLASLSLAPLIPVAVTFVSNQRMLEEFVGSIIQLVVREGFRYAPRGSLIRSPEELLKKLAGFTRNHLNAERCAYFHLDPERYRLGLVGGYEVDTERLGRLEGRPDAPPWSAAVGSHSSFRMLPSLGEGLGDPVCLIPIRPGRRLIGVWCVWLSAGDERPSTEKVARILDWLRLRLALEESDRRAVMRDSATAEMERDIAHVRELLVTAAEERRHQLETLRALASPLLVADFSGAVLYVNRALDELLSTTQLGTIESLRELVFKLRGADGLTEFMTGLYRQAKDVTFPWSATESTTFHVTIYPITREHHADMVLGYAAMFVDISLPLQLRRLRSTVLTYASDHIRNRLMVALGYTEMVQETLTDPSAAEQLQLVVDELQSVAEHLDGLQATVSLEEDVAATLPVDLTHMFEVAMARCSGSAQTKELTFQTEWPEAPQPVVLVASVAQEAITHLLRLVVDRAADGSEVFIGIHEQLRGTDVSVRFVGAAFDEETVALVTGGAEQQPSVEHLSAQLRPLAAVAGCFPEVEVQSGPGEPTVITWRVERGG